MKRLSPRPWLALAGCLCAAPASATVTFRYATVGSEVYLTMADNAYSNPSAWKSAGSLTYKNKLAATVPTSAVSRTGIGKLSGSTSASLSLPTRESGTVTFVQSATSAVNDPRPRESTLYVTGDFQYDFELSSTYTLQYTYAATAKGTQAYGAPFETRLIMETLGGGSSISNALLPDGSSAGQLVLEAGRYTMRMYVFNYAALPTGVGNATASLTSVFGFALREGEVPAAAPVPEPAAWALMLAGFTVLGGALRRPHARRTQLI